jgi:hypothetical protein
MNSAKKLHPNMRPIAVAALLCIGVSFALARTASGAEIIPSVGMTRPVEGSNESEFSAGLALRGELLPILKDEIAVSYRSESRFNDALRVRMYPITASLWLQPVPAIYAGGGVGFYNTTLDYDQDVVPLVEDETRQEFGVHLGGGLRVPLATAAAVDLSGRYVMMRDQESPLVPERFDPDFWSANLGLAFHF